MAWACAASRRTSGGISRPRRRTRPFTAFREPILVIVIFPYFASGGVRRGSGGGDVRASPRTGLSSSTPVVASYEWVRDDVLKYKSSLTSTTSVVALQH